MVQCQEEAQDLIFGAALDVVDLEDHFKAEVFSAAMQVHVGDALSLVKSQFSLPLCCQFGLKNVFIGYFCLL